MNVKRIVVVFKKDIYEPLENPLENIDSFKRLKKHSPKLYSRFQLAQEQHETAWRLMQKILDDFAVPVVFHVRGQKKMPRLKKDDLIISFGGDGTFMYASRFVKDSLLLGINSSPQTSIGYFCSFTLPQQEKEIRDVLALALKGELTTTKAKIKAKIKIKELHRLQLFIDNKAIALPVLNDVLITEKTPVITSRYLLRFNETTQVQKSSGLWISTAAGSSAAYRSAGGKPFKQFSKETSPQNLRFAFIVRELYLPQENKLTRSFVTQQDVFEITSAMKNGCVYIDGNPRPLPFVMGEKLQVKFFPHPLRVL